MPTARRRQRSRPEPPAAEFRGGTAPVGPVPGGQEPGPQFRDEPFSTAQFRTGHFRGEQFRQERFRTEHFGAGQAPATVHPGEVPAATVPLGPVHPAPVQPGSGRHQADVLDSHPDLHRSRPDRDVPPGRPWRRPARTARPGSGRLLVSGALALGLVTAVAGVATASNGVPFAGASRVAGVRTSTAHGTVTVTRIRCRLWFWCRSETTTSPAPAAPSGAPTGRATTPSATGIPTVPAPAGTATPSRTGDAPTASATRGTATVPAPTRSGRGAGPTAGGDRDGSSGAGSGSASRQDTPAQRILDQLNAARAAVGVAPLTMSDGLVRSAQAHTLLMAGGCGMEHECPGEAGLGERISAQGVRWNSVGENIGYGGPVARSDTGVTGMGRELTASMLAETPPSDGHRRNILNAGFHHVGISFYQDARGTVWMTQDFSN